MKYDKYTEGFVMFVLEELCPLGAARDFIFFLSEYWATDKRWTNLLDSDRYELIQKSLTRLTKKKILKSSSISVKNKEWRKWIKGPRQAIKSMSKDIFYKVNLQKSEKHDLIIKEDDDHYIADSASIQAEDSILDYKKLFCLIWKKQQQVGSFLFYYPGDGIPHAEKVLKSLAIEREDGDEIYLIRVVNTDQGIEIPGIPTVE